MIPDNVEKVREALRDAYNQLDDRAFRAALALLSTPAPRADIRRVVCSANRYATGHTVVGVRHGDQCMAPIIVALWIADEKCVQGFVDNRGIFMDRYEALKVAEAAGQIVEKHNPKDRLMSEDFIPGYLPAAPVSEAPRQEGERALLVEAERLCMEHCPDEMSDALQADWEKHQVSAHPPRSRPHAAEQQAMVVVTNDPPLTGGPKPMAYTHAAETGSGKPATSEEVRALIVESDRLKQKYHITMKDDVMAHLNAVTTLLRRRAAPQPHAVAAVIVEKDDTSQYGKTARLAFAGDECMYLPIGTHELFAAAPQPQGEKYESCAKNSDHCRNVQACQIAGVCLRVRAQQQGEWQPIETAPNDYNDILCYSKRDLIHVMTGRDVHEQRLQHGASCNWTHWQPLPPPPQPDEQEKPR